MLNKIRTLLLQVVSNEKAETNHFYEFREKNHRNAISIITKHVESLTYFNMTCDLKFAFPEPKVEPPISW